MRVDQLPGNRLLRIVILAVVVLMVALGMNGKVQAQGPEPESEGLEGVPAGPGHRPLDDVPGFGVTAQGVDRDDLIAIYESYQREGLVADCMAAVGFGYTADVQYVKERVVAVSGNLDLPSPSRSVVTDGNSANEQLRAGLGAEELNEYWTTLAGVTTDQVASFEQAGEIPESWDGEPEDFFRGGCIGSAADLVPSVWDIRRDLIPLYVETRAAIKDHPDFAPYRQEFTACVADATGSAVASRGELEALLVSNPDAAAGTVECELIWNEGIAATERVAMEPFENEHREVLAAQQSRYANAVNEINEDEEFLTWISAYQANANVGE